MTQEFITYKNSRIAFSSEGKGSAIVLLHGFLENSTMWNKIIPELSRKNRVICIDLLGHGNTDCLGYIHSMSEMAEAVQAVLKHLKLRRITLIGHSMGGYVAIAFAEKFSQNLKRLCFVNSTTQADSEERKQNRVRAIEMAQTNYKSLVSMSITNLFTQNSKVKFPKEIEIIKNEALKTPVQGYIACSEGMRMRPNREHVLKLKDVKKLYIIGQKDPILNVSSVIEEAKRNEISYRELSGGHMSHIENSIELMSILQDFIR